MFTAILVRSLLRLQIRIQVMEVTLFREMSDIDSAPNKIASKVTWNIVVRARHGYPGEYLTRDVIFLSLIHI